jgi:hypothetical protein
LRRRVRAYARSRAQATKTGTRKMRAMDKDVQRRHRECEARFPDKENALNSPRPTDVDSVRRRLLRLAAYAAPFVLTFGLPEAGRAVTTTPCPPPACRCGGRCGHVSPAAPKPQK